LEPYSFRNSFMQPKWRRSSIGRYKKENEISDHLEEDLAKSGYEPRGPNMKHKSLIITLYFGLHYWKPNIRIWKSWLLISSPSFPMI
jgi:hypothetical protein